MSYMTYITSFLDIPRFAVSPLTIISSTYFTCLSGSNALFFIGKAFSYAIGFLPILCKALNTVRFGNGSNHKSKQGSSHFPLTAGYGIFTKYFLRIGQFYSIHHEVIYSFATILYFSTLTVAVSCGADK